MSFKFIFRLLPFFLFMGLAVFLYRGLWLDPRMLPSSMLHKPAPSLALPTLEKPNALFSQETMKGRVWLLNVWATWCNACQLEHPVLMDMANEGAIIIGLDYKDEANKARNWLLQYGNPFKQVLQDESGMVGINLGVYGAPETFVVDKAGVIQYKHVGQVTQKIWLTVLKPLVKRLDA